MAGQHRRSIEDPSVKMGTGVRFVMTAAGFAFSVWLLLTYPSTGGLYVCEVFMAAAVPLILYLFGGKVKEWISAHEPARIEYEETGFFGQPLT